MRWLLLPVFALLPIQWVLVGTHVIGNQRLHILTLMLFMVPAFIFYPRAGFERYLRLTWPFVVGMGAIYFLTLITTFYFRQSLVTPIQGFVQVLIFVSLGTALSVTLSSASGARALRWAGTISTLALLAGLTVSTIANDINPAQVVSDTIARGDPAYFENRLFKAALVGYGFDAKTLKSNIRHEMFSAILISTCLSAIATRIQPFKSRAALIVTRVTFALSFVLILVSLSRSVTVAAAVWPILSLLRSWRLRRFSPGQIFAAVVGGLALALTSAIGFAGVILTRFTADTTSYDKRDDLLGRAFDGIATHFFAGGAVTVRASSHNFVLDSWLRAGILGALIAAAVTVVLSVLMATLVVRLHREPIWMVPASVTLALSLIRLFTAGGGDLPPVEWVAMAVFGAAMYHRRYQGLEGPRAADGQRSNAGTSAHPVQAGTT